MSHYHLEIIMPPTDDIEGAIKSILAPFDENGKDEDGDNNKHAFWDFYVIGGRWAGDKEKQKLDPEKLKAFYTWCDEEKITVSGLTCGKQELSPATQIPKVDAKWNELFPATDGSQPHCPLFKHSNNQYAKGTDGALNGDITLLKDSLDTVCARVIIAGPSYNHEERDADNPYTGPYEANYMISDDVWNGVTWITVDWDKTVKSAVAKYKDKIESYKDTYREMFTPKDDWLCVTVDYHN